MDCLVSRQFAVSLIMLLVIVRERKLRHQPGQGHGPQVLVEAASFPHRSVKASHAVAGVRSCHRICLDPIKEQVADQPANVDVSNKQLEEKR